MKNIAATIPLLLAACVFVGCNDANSDHPATYPTSVKITMDGEPVEGATVTLDSVDPENDYSPYGRTDSNGVAELSTFDSGDGVVPGEYYVAVRKIESITEPDPAEEDPDGVKVVEERHIVPRKYQVFDNGLEITVRESGSNDFEFDVAE